MLASKCDSRCKALIRLQYGIWVSRQEAEIRLILASTTTALPAHYTVSTTTTVTSVSTTAVAVTVLPKAPSPTLTFWDYLAIWGNYAISFLVFMGQFANYHHYSQVGEFYNP